jgi:hypothetical protein
MHNIYLENQRNSRITPLPSQHGDSGPDALEPWKEKDFLRDFMEEKGGGPFSWVVQAW